MFGSHAIVSADSAFGACLECGTEFETEEALAAAPRCPGVQEIGPCYVEEMAEPAGHVLGIVVDALECHVCGARGDTGVSLEGVNARELTRFLQGYALAMLWANTTNGEGDDRAEVDPYAWQTPGESWAVEAFDSASQSSMREDVQGFLSGAVQDVRTFIARTMNGDDSRAWLSGWESAGHDFALTRNGHGAGYWDRGAGDVGRTLTDWAHTFGESTAYVSDEIVSLY